MDETWDENKQKEGQYRKALPRRRVEFFEFNEAPSLSLISHLLYHALADGKNWESSYSRFFIVKELRSCATRARCVIDGFAN